MANEQIAKEIPRILVVDDVETNRYVLRNIITDMGYQPVLAENGLQAQKIIQRIPIQLILSDIAMPEMDGYEFCKWIKETQEYREIPFIFISAYDNPQDVVEGFSIGGEDYITKPFIAEVVKARVGLHLKLATTAQTLQDTNRRLNASVQEQLRQMEQEKKTVLYALAEVARENACYEEAHAKRLQENCRILAQAMQLSSKFEQEISDSFVDSIVIAAPLCDIGNVAIPMEILQKDEQLDKDERSIMQKHTDVGAKLLHQVHGEGDYNDFVELSADVAQNHHENWDGSGYPRGISGEEIPLAAQIVSVVSAYCALTEKRVYRPAYSKEDALSIMTIGAGNKFNQEIVDILIKISRQLH